MSKILKLILMKSIFSFLLLLSISFTAYSQTSGAFLSLESDSLNYGIIKKGSNGEREITIKNTGDKPLIISDCKGTCGCTIPKCPTIVILPGSKSKITITYDTFRVGKFNKTVSVRSNAINHITYIKVTGEVIL